MKSLSLTSIAIILSSFALFSPAHAACLNTDVIANPNDLVGKTVCVVGESQEFHDASGDLIDYKKGAGDPVDQTTSVGSWSISGTNITYNYGSSTFTYTYRQNPDRYCGANGEFLIAEILDGLSQCSWAAVAP